MRLLFWPLPASEFSVMSSALFPFRRFVSPQNSSLIESWCPGCGVFIAAAEDVRNLQAAESSHNCHGQETASIPPQNQRDSSKFPKSGTSG